jgi:hypothetical protein
VIESRILDDRIIEGWIDDGGIIESGINDGWIIECGINDGGIIECGIDDGGIIECGIDDGGIIECGIDDGGIIECGIIACDGWLNRWSDGLLIDDTIVPPITMGPDTDRGSTTKVALVEESQETRTQGFWRCPDTLHPGAGGPARPVTHGCHKRSLVTRPVTPP